MPTFSEVRSESEDAVSTALQGLAAAWHAGRPKGIYSVCSAHPWVLEAAVDQALDDDTDLLIEATSNQVNHEGGYTGMQPEDFRKLVVRIAATKGFDDARLILGGDHLGPNPWRHLPAAEAMRRAEQMVQAYVQAGFRKVHLDASMACADERGPLAEETIARRAAALCSAGERYARLDALPVYVIGTEVPTPGGATESLDHLHPTSEQAAAQTVAMHKRIFQESGLEAVWPRVIAVVVQPGVEFNHLNVVDYDPAGATHLTEFLKQERGLIYEAHSTDYQRPQAYRDLVRDGFAILKVGPALTFAMREALEALALIEADLVDPGKRSGLIQVLEQAMLVDPRHWEQHYSGDEGAKRLLRRYSYSDRVRYYWTTPLVTHAVETLMSNMKDRAIPETMLSAYLPQEYAAVRAGELEPEAQAIVRHRIRAVLRMYSSACASRRVSEALSPQTRMTSMPAAVNASKSSLAS